MQTSEMLCLYYATEHYQGRPQADAQDARASTKLMDLEVSALLKTLVLAYSAIYDRFYFHFFFISLIYSTADMRVPDLLLVNFFCHTWLDILLMHIF